MQRSSNLRTVPSVITAATDGSARLALALATVLFIAAALVGAKLDQPVTGPVAGAVMGWLVSISTSHPLAQRVIFGLITTVVIGSYFVL